ncbi:MAG: MBL fold metallo-hydrolase [Spirochaetaceae bacterium]|jgi:glyoxylase-like metal-dependent hydrolase (beta-lactamase superfamily II)|nr:MBL fold metallo-hydrolase [Spirochaetaceae bacterium]
MVEEVIVGALATNCWIYPLEQAEDSGGNAKPKDQGRPCALIDPGADAEAIISQLESLGLYPEYILLTHGHFDHIGALGPLAAHYSQHKPVIGIHRMDAGRIGRNAYKAHRLDFNSMGIPDADLVGPLGLYIEALRRGLPEPGRLLEDGDRIGPFTVIHLPGHSPGSIGFYDEARDLIFDGDVLFQNGIGRTDLPGGNWDEMLQSLKKLFTLNGKTRVYPGHGPATTLADERRQFASL